MKRFIYLLHCLSMVFGSAANVLAEDKEKTYYVSRIPDYMQPLTEIEFVDTNHFVIKKGRSYWGYTYSKSTSINNVVISHAAVY